MATHDPKQTAHEIDAAYDSVAAVVRDRLEPQSADPPQPAGRRPRADRSAAAVSLRLSDAAGRRGRGHLRAGDHRSGVPVRAGRASSTRPASRDWSPKSPRRCASISARFCSWRFGPTTIGRQELPPRDATRPGFRVIATQAAALAKTAQGARGGAPRDSRCRAGRPRWQWSTISSPSPPGQAPLSSRHGERRHPHRSASPCGRSTATAAPASSIR